MITTNISTCLDKPLVLVIGRQLEDNYRQFVFDCSGFGSDITSVTLVHQRKNDVAPYLVTSTNTDTLTWNVSDTDTAYSGYGKAELRIEFADGLAKSAIYTTFVLESITADATIPEPLQSWYDAMIAYIDEHSVSPEEIEEAVSDYLEEHPITAPVTSVNSKIGDVVLNASDVGALPNTTVIPTKTSQLQNDSGYITSAPVTSVNGQTGAVTVTDSDTTYTFSISSNVITVTASNGVTQTITLPAVNVQNMTSSDTSVTLNKDTFYVFPEMATLTVTVSASGMYAFRFVSGATATVLTVNNATMPDSFSVEANKTYEVNVYQGYAVVTSWS